MNILSLFHSKSKLLYFIIFLLSVASSITNIGVMFLINKALRNNAINGSNDFRSSFFFILLILTSFVASRYFQKYMVFLTNNIAYDMELNIIEKVRNSSYESFEKIGDEKIYGIIGDVGVISRSPYLFINFSNSSLTIICGLGYILYTSLLSGLTLFLIMGILFLVYFIRDRRIAKTLYKIRDLQDVYYGYLGELLKGFKQFKVSRKRNDNLYNKYLLNNRSYSKGLNIKASKEYAVNEMSGMFSWYLLIGLIIFVFPTLLKISSLQMTAFITTVIFMMSPLSQLISLFPAFRSFKISFERLGKYDEQLLAVTAQKSYRNISFNQSIRFEDIMYSYQDDHNQQFDLCIKELIIDKYDIHFIVGGNGSGKTTFINILTGLYKPASGKVYVDEIETDWDDYSNLCNDMSVIFTDHNLFKHNYDEHDLSSHNTVLKGYIDKFNLEDILKIDQQTGFFNDGLSKGQHKRLALILCLLENKPFLILDEWAAEQDLANRNAFYAEWLQDIKKMGKTMVAITHDDDYFHHADKVIRFDKGRVIDVKMNKENFSKDIFTEIIRLPD